MIKDIHKLLAWTAAFTWMGFIFILSHQPASSSSELSSGIVQIISEMTTTVFPFISIDIDQLHFYIRKGAHFFAYFTLGILVLHAITLRHKMTLRYFMISLVICVLYAMSDEFHQLFIPGRSGEVRDVLIDSAGSVIGLSVYVSVVNLWKRLSRKT